jgi:arylsulfatase A-like enzyme
VPPRSLLLLLTDQQRADTMACYGNDFVQAPHLERLAAHSCVFRRAYCAEPTCTPSRATLLTGLWPHRHGCTRNNVPLAADLPTLGERLPDDYRRAWFGKWHLGDELLPQHGFAEWLSIEDGPYRRYYSDRGQLERRSDYHHFLEQRGLRPDARARDGARVFSRRFAAGLEAHLTKSAFLADRAARWLREQQEGRPFAMVVSFLEPHPPYLGPLDDLHRPERVPAGPAFARPPDRDAPAFLRRRARRHARGHKGMALATPADWRRLRARYLGGVSLVDRAVGTVLDALQQAGREDDTVVIFTSDHGEMLGDHALLGKGVPYEQAVRVPWLVRVPGLAPRAVEEPVGHIDLLPTLLDLLGVDAKAPELDGASRAGLLRGEATPSSPVMVELSAARIRSVVAPDGFKLNAYADDRWQLFDLRADPAEQTNLWGRPEHAERASQLVEFLRDWQAKTGDPLDLGDPDHRPGPLRRLWSAATSHLGNR